MIESIIESGIKIPEFSAGASIGLPLSKMKVGDSVKVPDGISRIRVASVLSRLKKNSNGEIEFTLRSIQNEQEHEGKSYRVWRIK